MGKNKENLIEFFLEHVKHVKRLSTINRHLEIFVCCGMFCHQITRNINGKVVIEDCADLYSNHEEADTRLLLRTKHASATHDRIIICSPDTDVFILLLRHKTAIPAAIYFDTGVGNQRRILDVSKVHSTIGPELCDALIRFMYCF